jgi:hypothetical protein
MATHELDPTFTEMRGRDLPPVRRTYCGRLVLLTRDPGYLFRLGGQRRAYGPGMLHRAPAGEAPTCAKCRVALARREHRAATASLS